MGRRGKQRRFPYRDLLELDIADRAAVRERPTKRTLLDTQLDGEPPVATAAEPFADVLRDRP
jgi:hypothetical protein